MDIENAVHALVDDVVHDLLHPGHPDGIHLVPRPRGLVPVPVFIHPLELDGPHVRIPGHRDADGVEAGFLEHAEEFPRGDRLPPGGLVRFVRPGRIGLDPHVAVISAVGVQRIPEVPAGAHLPDRIGRALPDGRIGLLAPGLRDRHCPGQGSRLYGHRLRTALIRLIGLDSQADLQLVVGIGAHGLGPDPGRTGRHIRAGRRRNRQGDRLPGLADVKDVAAEGDGGRCEGLLVFPAGGSHPEDGQKEYEPFHYFP